MNRQKSNRFNLFNLIREIGISDFKVRYNNSVLGYFWSLGKPLMLFSVLYVVFYRFLRFGADTPNFPVYLLVGIILWTYFAESTVMAMNSVVGKGSLVRKIYFPREVIVISSSITTTLTFLINLVVIFGFIAVLRIPLGINALWLIPLLIELYVLVLGVSLILSAMFVRFRDIGHIWEVGLQAFFYATPVIYPVSVIPEKYRELLLLNPVAQIIQDTRYILITDQTVTSAQVLTGAATYVPYVIPVLLLLVGIKYYRSASASFAEDV